MKIEFQRNQRKKSSIENFYLQIYLVYKQISLLNIDLIKNSTLNLKTYKNTNLKS